MTKYLKYQGQLYQQVTAAPKEPKLRLTDEDLDKMGLIRVGRKVMTLDELSSLPELRVRGDLVLEELVIDKLPSKLVVDGILALAYSRVDRMPDELHVGSHLYLDRTRIRKLPKILSVGGGMYLSTLSGGDSTITKLPENLVVGRNLRLSTRIEELPRNLSVGGDLLIEDSRVTALPEDLSVRGKIYCRSKQLKAIPDKFRKKIRIVATGAVPKLQLTRDFDKLGLVQLEDQVVTREEFLADRTLWPKASRQTLNDFDIVEVGNDYFTREEFDNIGELPQLRIAGHWRVEDTPMIDKLPRKLEIEGDLTLPHYHLQMPEELRVGRSLYIERSMISELPKRLTIGGSLHIVGGHIKELPRNLRVGENLTIAYTSLIRELPENLTVGGKLYLRGVVIRELPESLEVGGDIIVRQGQFEVIPQKFEKKIRYEY